MKGVFRSGVFQGLLARLIGFYGELIIATLRWRLVDFEAARTAIASPKGLIALFWHGRIAQAIACRPLLGTKARRVMISQSRDGAFIALAATRLGIPTIRGSTGREASVLAKGGAGAFRAAVKIISQGGAMLITPDGPRGPAQVMPTGPVHLARAARSPVFLLGLAATPCLAPKTWDGARLPLPFARAVLVVGGPFHAPLRLDEAGAEATRLAWQEALTTAQTRAEALLRQARPQRTLGLHAYALLTATAAPLLAPWLMRRRAQGKEDPHRWREKLGYASLPRPDGELIWLHGVSVGESLALIPLAQMIARERPQAALLITTATRAAAEMVAARAPRLIHQFAPLDTPGAVRRFLDHWHPQAGILAESELWPNLILEAQARGVRLVLASARLSPASRAGWARAPAAAHRLLGAFERIWARDTAAQADLESLGARVEGCLDLKLAAPALTCDPERLSTLRRGLAGRRVILAASTHPGEEVAIVDAFVAAGGVSSGGLLILAPRHVERGAALGEEIARRGLRVGARREGADPAGLDVYIADTLGELGLFYRLAAAAVIGGSFGRPELGGHNPLEAARLACPVICGPHTGAWPIYDAWAQAGAIRRESERGLAAALAEALRGELASMGRRAQGLAARADEAAGTARTALIARLTQGPLP